MNNIVTTAEAELNNLETQLTDATQQVTTQKIKIIDALRAHVEAHQAIIDRHQAEIVKTREIIQRALPSPAQPATETVTAKFLLTGKDDKPHPWRLWVGSAMVVIILAGKFYWS